jgi:tungstate transport system substrate-binding protein
MTRLVPLLLLLLAGCGPDAPRLVLATTHTVEDSGLLDSLATAFRDAHPEHDLQVVVAASGEALELGARGDADVLLTHSPDAETQLVREARLLDRRPVMHNYFVLLGPRGDPYLVRGAQDAVSAFERMRDMEAPFVSRGDASGTQRKELSLWRRVDVLRPAWAGYIEAGTGMADALRIASERGAYILSEPATWLMLRSELALELVFAGDSILLNAYAVLRSPKARNREGALVFAAWITSAGAQGLIGRYGSQRSPEALFIPTAFPDSARH